MGVYEDALRFWNEAYRDVTPSAENDGSTLGCAVLEERLSILAEKGDILDFGCGAGWASAYMQLKGARVLGIDQSASAIDAATVTRIPGARFVCADETYLDTLPAACMDGMFSCNTLDVIPSDIAARVMTAACRVLRAHAPVILSFNPYLSESLRERLHMEALGDGQYAKNGVLRCVNRTAEEWTQFISPWLDVKEIIEYRFDAEEEGLKRRMLICTRKAETYAAHL